LYVAATFRDHADVPLHQTETRNPSLEVYRILCDANNVVITQEAIFALPSCLASQDNPVTFQIHGANNITTWEKQMKINKETRKRWKSPGF
jgi:hypothetical protein